jgi:hypothetical protein
MSMTITSPSGEGARYYAHAGVRRCMREYCGERGGHASAHFVSQLSPDHFITWAEAPRFSPAALPALWTAGWDISRSLLDRDSLIVYFEIDVADPDAPEDALLRPAQAFFDVEPVYRAVRTELTRLGLSLLDVMTGRGYHFAGTVPLAAHVVGDISSVAPTDAPATERSHIGLGMLLEHLAHNIYRRAAKHRVPVVIDGVEVGRGGVGREAVSLDLSGYGDPVGARQMRVAYSTYQSHRVRPDIFGAYTAREVPVLAAVPRRGRSLFWMLEHARTAEQAADLAEFDDARLPDVTTGMDHLFAEYKDSPLAAFHRVYYGVPMHGPARWEDTYDRLAPDDVVPCIGEALRAPNDALLKPTVLQQLTRYLMARGWSPRHVAGLVWSKYARDSGWGDRWAFLDPQRRAEFDVRVFAGALVTGLDHAVDFNCMSSQEKGLCPRSSCQHDLRHDRARLMERLGV